MDAGLVAVFEAKIGGWPGRPQLARYADRLRREGKGDRVLVALGVPPHCAELWRLTEIGGIRLALLRWVDVLELVNNVSPRTRGLEYDALVELKLLIQEVIKMQSYDREVLVRDLDCTSPSYRLFLEHGLYACQPNERAEPLFFAPCFTHATTALGNGIHYVSRVYYRHIVPLSDLTAVADALEEANEVVQRHAEPLEKKKGAADQLAYLRTLPTKWRRGLTLGTEHRRRDAHAVFFLGDPIRLPVPLKKHGKMVPIGFSMTLERLMSAEPGTFRC